MVVKNPDEGTIEIYEIKHSDKIVSDQAKHLRDEEKCELAQYRFGNIVKRGFCIEERILLWMGLSILM